MHSRWMQRGGVNLILIVVLVLTVVFCLWTFTLGK